MNVLNIRLKTVLLKVIRVLLHCVSFFCFDQWQLSFINIRTVVDLYISEKSALSWRDKKLSSQGFYIFLRKLVNVF